MSMIKNKSTIYAVMRRDEDLKRDVLCCFSKTLDESERLCCEYEQAFLDSGGNSELTYYYTVGNVFYDA